MRSKYNVKWRHNATSTKFITVNWSNRSFYRDSRIINKIIRMNDIVISYVFFIRNAMIKKICLADDSELSGISKCFMCEFSFQVQGLGATH